MIDYQYKISFFLVELASLQCEKLDMPIDLDS
jgi:hypothetical protein